MSSIPRGFINQGTTIPKAAYRICHVLKSPRQELGPGIQEAQLCPHQVRVLEQVPYSFRMRKMGPVFMEYLSNINVGSIFPALSQLILITT